MRRYNVTYGRRALSQISALEFYIRQATGPKTAANFVDDLFEHLESLAIAPYRGAVRQPRRPDLRSIGWRKRVTIAFRVDEQTRRVFILGIFYRGQDVDGHL